MKKSGNARRAIIIQETARCVEAVVADANKEPCILRIQTVIVNDKMQHGYRYQLTEPAGRNFDPEFRPELTPQEMLWLGVFCGKYMTDTRDEFPRAGSWAPSLPRRGATVRSTISASMPASRFRYGASADGFIPTIRAAGSSGIVATTVASHGRRRPEADQALESDAASISRKSKLHCEPGDRFCDARQRQALCTERMTAGKFESKVDYAVVGSL
jgi:hypothetical protein